MDSYPSSSSLLSDKPSVESLNSQLAQAYAQQFIEILSMNFTLKGTCFEKCVPKPGSSLSGSESSCVSRCVDRYIEATGIISKALFSQR